MHRYEPDSHIMPLSELTTAISTAVSRRATNGSGLWMNSGACTS
uniref:Uncharacterized protein n=1 Tax=Arundo donax TaxID=35708 RepID=A0A0A8YPS4_ARUDO